MDHKHCRCRQALSVPLTSTCAEEYLLLEWGVIPFHNLMLRVRMCPLTDPFSALTFVAHRNGR